MFEQPESVLHKAFDENSGCGKAHIGLSILFSLICLNIKDNPERRGFLHRILRFFLRYVPWDAPTDKEIDMIVDMVDNDPEGMVMKYCNNEDAKIEFKKVFDQIREEQ
ncbi:MAG: hypothetical protein J6Z11_09090 [Candidatus Riflebacteria bacterium]|nr:hypothetical protein [Candidatus Riflebacteria bacterium]